MLKIRAPGTEAAKHGASAKGTCSASGNELGVDNRQALRIVTALEIKRCVLGGVDVRHLPRI
jgi:hypothetical protein